MKNKIKIYIGIAGIVITVLGWAVANIENLPVVNYFVSPKYYRAMKAYQKTMEDGAVLSDNDSGFKEICDVLNDRVEGDIKPQIKKIIVNYCRPGQWYRNNTLQTGYTHYLDIVIEKYPTQSVKITFFEEDINKKYLGNKIFIASTAIFFIGVVISAVAVFL